MLLHFLSFFKFFILIFWNFFKFFLKYFIIQTWIKGKGLMDPPIKITSKVVITYIYIHI